MPQIEAPFEISLTWTNPEPRLFVCCVKTSFGERTQPLRCHGSLSAEEVQGNLQDRLSYSLVELFDKARAQVGILG